MKRGYALISNHQANSSLQSAETLHALGMTDNVKARWWRGHQQFLYCQSAASERAVLMSAVTKTVRMALQSLMLGLGCWLAILGDISPGMMISGLNFARKSAVTGGTTHQRGERLPVSSSGMGTRGSSDGRLSPAQESICLPAAQGVLTVENVTVFPPGNPGNPYCKTSLCG